MLLPLLRSDFRTVDKRDPLAVLAGWMRGESRDVPIVCDDGKPYGIVAERKVLRRNLTLEQRVEDFTIPLPLLSPSASIVEALSIVASAYVPHAPVADGKDLLGYADAVDLLGRTASDLPARSLAASVPVLTSTTTVAEAIHAFNANATSVLPVLDAGSRLSGVVARRALVASSADPRGRGRAYSARFPPASEGFASDLRDERYEVVPANASFGSVVRVLRDFRFAVVMDEARLVGVVTPEGAARVVTEAQMGPAIPLPAPRGRGRWR